MSRSKTEKMNTPQLEMRNMPKHTPKREIRQPKIKVGGLERSLATPELDLTLKTNYNII